MARQPEPRHRMGRATEILSRLIFAVLGSGVAVALMENLELVRSLGRV